jgi:hypothetical protein
MAIILELYIIIYGKSKIFERMAGEKSWAEARREEEEDLTSARGSYKSANNG